MTRIMQILLQVAVLLVHLWQAELVTAQEQEWSAFGPSNVIQSNILGNTDKINYLDAFIDALSGGGTLRTEIFYS